MDHFVDLLLANLKGQISRDTRDYPPVKETISALCRETGRDFGTDLEAWERYLRSNYDLPSNRNRSS